MDPALTALNRFGMGARVGERDELGGGADGARDWLAAQLTAGPPSVDEVASLDDVSKVLTLLDAAQQSQDQDALQAATEQIGAIRAREARAMLTERVNSQRPFVERLVAFWSNHLCVSIGASRPVVALAGHYERAAIRPHVLGRFDDMVLASAQHPAMLFYLNNLISIGPISDVGRRSSRRGNPRGLNENYARELLELHTLGVGGGYDQDDVEQLARILTGWTVATVGNLAEPGERFGFLFRPELHEPSRKFVLGKRYRENGVAEGEEVIRDLCAHPSTSTFIAGKLVAHFVDDDPPASAVARIADVFRDSHGDLRRVSAALVDLAAAWEPGHRKFRTPQDWLVALLRAAGAREAPENLDVLLNQLRHTPWRPASPKGYGDSRAEWADPAALMNRAELARSIARRLSRAGRLAPDGLLGVMDVGADDPLVGLLADDAIPTRDRLALAFAGPAFQWR